MILPPRPLLLLAKRKLRGTVRKQVARLRTPSGAIFAILGALVVFGWLASIAAGSLLRGAPPPDPESLRSSIRLAGTIFLVLSLSGALQYRGLYLPADEIEPLFAAPVSRADLVRYRMFVQSSRSLIATVILGLFVLGRAPHPLFAVVGVLLGLATIGVVGQAAAILAGLLEQRVSAKFTKLPAVVMSLVAILGIALLFFWGGLSAAFDADDLERFVPRGVSGLPDHPVLAAITTPFEPWARTVSATSWAEFAPWAALCLGLWVLAVEATARLPIDFRELSLETSSNVAERIRRHRASGGGAAAASVSKGAAGWRVPRLFGSGPVGALAWRKLVSIVRRARGTVTISAFVLVFLVALSTFMFGERDAGSALGGGVFVLFVGTIYLCGGLRFDFREDLDRMDVVKTWPLPPRRIFAGMLLAEVAMVSALLVVAILARSVFVRAFHPALLGVFAATPLLVAAWIAIDNIVFLFSPVRFVPGQDGALHNAGRSVVTTLVRFAVFSVVGGGTAGVVLGVWFLGVTLGGAPEGVTATAAVALGLALLALADWGLVVLGGWALARFDVARDRG